MLCNAAKDGVKKAIPPEKMCDGTFDCNNMVDELSMICPGKGKEHKPCQALNFVLIFYITSN